jgi:trigger factor
MQANLETLGQLERRLSIAVPMAEIDSEVESRLKRLTRTVKMAGFRPGKVPFKVVVQQYGGQVRQEVLGDTLQKTFGEAVTQQNLKVAGYPKFEAKPVADNAGQFEYSATFEVYPEIVVGDISQRTITRPALQVTDAEVDKTLEIMRKQRASFDQVERAAADGDRLTITYRGTIDGKEFSGSAAQDSTVMLGERRLLPDFEAQLRGMKSGEKRTFEVRFPDDYHGSEVAGKTAAFDVTLTQVAEPKLPEVNADFAKSLGVDDGDIGKMRAEIRANLEREVKGRLKNRLKDQVMQALLDVTQIEVPRSLVEMEIQRMQTQARQDLAARGIPVKDDMPIPSEMFEKQGQRRVNLGLILAEVVKIHNLRATPEQVRAVVEEQAQSYEHAEEVIKWFYQSPERLREIESMVLEDNVVAWAIGAAKVEDKAIAFDDLMENK